MQHVTEQRVADFKDPHVLELFIQKSLQLKSTSTTLIKDAVKMLFRRDIDADVCDSISKF